MRCSLLCFKATRVQSHPRISCPLTFQKPNSRRDRYRCDLTVQFSTRTVTIIRISSYALSLLRCPHPLLESCCPPLPAWPCPALSFCVALPCSGGFAVLCWDRERTWAPLALVSPTRPSNCMHSLLAERAVGNKSASTGGEEGPVPRPTSSQPAKLPDFPSTPEHPSNLQAPEPVEVPSAEIPSQPGPQFPTSSTRTCRPGYHHLRAASLMAGSVAVLLLVHYYSYP